MTASTLGPKPAPIAAAVSHGPTRALLLVALAAIVTLEGCSAIPAVPANRVPAAALVRSKESMIELSLSRLRQTPPDAYRLAPDDVLGIYIENVLGGDEDAPPVNFPEDDSQSPSIGYPIPVREDGTLALPFVDPISVYGLTVEEATEAIRDAYTEEREILVKGEDAVIVTLMKRRAYRILVVREEEQGSGGLESVLGLQKRGTGYAIDLPAYENDLLHALNETGGLPGLDAEPYVLIYKGGAMGSVARDELIASLNGGVGKCGCKIPLPDNPHAIKIPIRFFPENLPRFSQADIILDDGDIVYIPSRDGERYYTGGVLDGGEHLLPRDRDLNVLQAVAIHGGSFGAGTGLAGFGGRGGGNIYGGGAGGAAIPPSRAIVLRKLDGCGTEIPIEVNLKTALTNPAERILVAPEDTIIVRYTLCEELANAALSLFQVNYFINGRR